MTLSKEELDLLNQLNQKIARADNSPSLPQLKNYVFQIKAAHILKKATIAATSKSEAEEIMFERYGDLPYELIEII